MVKKIILVDDSSTVLMTAEMALESLVANGDIELKLYENPEILLEEITNGLDYDLLITDINMPEMSGFELAKALKKMERVKAKPIIALTTENSSQRKRKVKQLDL